MAEETLSEKLAKSTERCRAMDAPLAERLASFADDVRKFSPEFASIVDAMVARLTSAGMGSTAPEIGETMPAFLMPDQSGRLVALDSLLERGPVVLSFHRGQWCPYCRINADALARLEKEVADIGAQVVLVTPNLAEFNTELKGSAAFPVLSDLENGYALQLDLAFRVPDEKRQAMTASGWDIAPFQGSDAWLLPVPATFVIGRDGKVRARFIDPDYRRRMAIEDIKAALANA